MREMSRYELIPFWVKEPFMTKFLSLAALSVAMVALAGVVAQPLAAQ
jgi:hypothetical protein